MSNIPAKSKIEQIDDVAMDMMIALFQKSTYTSLDINMLMKNLDFATYNEKISMLKERAKSQSSKIEYVEELLKKDEDEIIDKRIYGIKMGREKRIHKKMDMENEINYSLKKLDEIRSKNDNSEYSIDIEYKSVVDKIRVPYQKFNKYTKKQISRNLTLRMLENMMVFAEDNLNYFKDNEKLDNMLNSIAKCMYPETIDKIDLEYDNYDSQDKKNAIYMVTEKIDKYSCINRKNNYSNNIDDLSHDIDVDLFEEIIKVIDDNDKMLNMKNIKEGIDLYTIDDTNIILDGYAFEEYD